MPNNSKMVQNSKKKWIYFLEEKRPNGNIYAFVCTTLPSEQELIKDIEIKHSKLKGKLRPFKKIQVDGKDTEKWFRDQLNQLKHDGETLNEYYDHENHDILYIKAPERAAKNAKTIIEKLIKGSPAKKNSNNTGVSILLIVGVILGISLLSQLSPPKSGSEPILHNSSSESDSYKDCVDGNGGRACLRLTKAYKDCVNNSGGQACEKLSND
jgi:hypothetical protein